MSGSAVVFEDFDSLAAELGWKRQFTKDMRLGRRFDRGAWTIRVFATSDGRNLSRASISYQGYTRTAMVSKHAGKRETALGWLRDPEATR